MRTYIYRGQVPGDWKILKAFCCVCYQLNQLLSVYVFSSSIISRNLQKKTSIGFGHHYGFNWWDEVAHTFSVNILSTIFCLTFSFGWSKLPEILLDFFCLFFSFCGKTWAGIERSFFMWKESTITISWYIFVDLSTVSPSYKKTFPLIILYLYIYIYWNDDDDDEDEGSYALWWCMENKGDIH